MNKSKRLKELINSDKTLIMPDAYDPVSAKLIQKAGFKAVQCSGYSFSIQAGYKREIDVNLDENIERTQKIVEAINIPVMADAEDGYGDPEEVLDAVDRFIQAGVAGLNIEDQIPGSYPLSIVDEDLMVQKIILARETAEAEGVHDFIINGRTDALKSGENREEGLEIAIDRANQYLDAGADLAFIAYMETLEEVKKAVDEVKGPISVAAGMPYNIGEFSIYDLKKCGVARVSLPTLMIFSSLQAMESSLKSLKKDNLPKFAQNLYSTNELLELLK